LIGALREDNSRSRTSTSSCPLPIPSLPQPQVPHGAAPRRRGFDAWFIIMVMALVVPMFRLFDRLMDYFGVA
jgi:hypothetical protein